MEVKVFGIRHHGPGSARALGEVLRSFQPDCLLVEGPADGNALVPFIAEKDLKPPVAMLIYDPKDFQWAAYFPFARFSPEWQAIKLALKKEIPVRLIDWPLGLAWEMEQTLHRENLFSTPQPKRSVWQRDPLGYLANMAGYADSERWWDIHFERVQNPLEVFELIAEMMSELRSEIGHGDDSNLWREAHMRREIRKAVKEGHERIAVVCGAWHVPALQAWQGIPASTDNKVFRGVRKRKTQASWIPWSYERLAYSSGYAAGVESPAWYQLLYDKRSEVTIRFLTLAARLLRKEDLDASSAQVIDAVRLAEGLAALRQLPIPGIQELREAALSSFCEGSPQRLELIDKKLIVGDRVGKVPGHLPLVPIQKDLEAQIRSCRMKREYISSEYITKKLDLRVDSNRKASILLHRLIALDIPWGTKLSAREGALGSFQEQWRLKWKASFPLKLIESSIYGRTVVEAAAQCLLKRAAESEKLAELSEWAGLSLLGELPETLDFLIRRLNEVAARSQDIPGLLEALPVLTRVFRYGDVRRTPPEAVGELIRQWVPRIAVGLVGACVALEEDEARIRFKQIIEADRAILLLNESPLAQLWQQAIAKLPELDTIAPLIRGGASRLCLDGGLADVTSTSRRMHYTLSDLSEIEASAAWLEGFLYGSGLLLIHQEELWKVVDDWVNNLPYERFRSVLPLLRRAFSEFPEAERKQIWKLVMGEPTRLTTTSSDWVPVREAEVLPVLQQLFASPKTDEEELTQP